MLHTHKPTQRLARVKRYAPALTALFAALLVAGCASDASDQVDPDACVGASCGADTTMSMDVTPDMGCEKNACGGCGELTGTPGESCGQCATLVCDGSGALVCNNAMPNACGGCETLLNTPGDACGTCGEVECDGKEKTVCTEMGSQNACGGCSILVGKPGEACGECGTGQYECTTKDAIVCKGGERNSCGGCDELMGKEGAPCGCGGGRFQCNGIDSMACVNDTAFNACDGCGTLEGTIGDPCGPCNDGQLECNEDGSALVCGGLTDCDPCNPDGGVDGNDDVETAQDLGDMDDGDDGSHLDRLHNSADVDVFKIHVEDKTFFNLEIVAELEPTAANLDLCVLWQRDDGEPTEVTCPGLPDGYINVDGIEGCCSVNSGTEKEIIQIEDGSAGAGPDDSGTAYYFVLTLDEDIPCEEYTLNYSF